MVNKLVFAIGCPARLQCTLINFNLLFRQYPSRDAHMSFNSITFFYKIKSLLNMKL